MLVGGPMNGRVVPSGHGGLRVPLILVEEPRFYELTDVVDREATWDEQLQWYAVTKVNG
jgi:hypothetical protein